MKIPKELLSVILIGVGLSSSLFGMWQLNLMTADYATSVWNTPFTINVELFPNMTFGVAYDLTMIMNLLSWFPTVIGAYYLPYTIKTIKKKLRLMGVNKH